MPIPGPPSPPSQTPQMLNPDGLANQLFDAALIQHKSDPREAARRVIMFLTESLVYAISSTASDEAARKAMLKSVGDMITAAPQIPKKP